MKKHFLLLALAAICSLSVGAVDYATSANFMEIMQTYGSSGKYYDGVTTELANHYFTAGNASAMYWENRTDVDGGLGWDGWNSLSFNVKANSSVTITFGATSGYGNSVQVSLNGGSSWNTVWGDANKNPVTVNYTIENEAQIQIQTSSGWTRVKDITISDMSPKTVSFNTQGGTPETIEPITELSFGAGITLPVAPTKSGYIFDGWYTAATGGTFAGNAGANYKPADNCTLHAHWAGYAESIDFKALADKYGFESTQNLSEELSACNYSLSSLNNVMWDNGLKIVNDIRSLSFWVKANQKVTIQVADINGGTLDNTATLTLNGVPYTIYQNTTTDYTTTEQTLFVLTTQQNPGVWITWNQIQKINIKALDYTITFNPGEGSGEMDPEPKKENETYQLISPTPDYFTPPTGYHFKEWLCSYDSKSYAAGVTYTMPASNVTFTAQWEEDSEVEYTVEYANGGGTWVTEPTEADHKAGETFTLPASSVVSRTGYQFAGWNDGTTTFAAEATYTMPSDNVTLTAQWNKLYTVTYAKGEVDYSGVLPIEPDHIDGATFKVADAIHIAGYAFKGWKADKTYQPGETYTMTAANVEFVAQWEAVTVPTVTDLTITEPVNEIVPLSWNIPGLVDISKAMAPYQPTGDPTDKNPKLVINADGSVTSTFTLGNCGNSGVGFPIPSGVVDKMSFEYKVALPSNNCFVWGGAGNGDGEPHVNWQGKSTGKLTGDKADWTPAQCTMNEHYWENNKHTDADDQVAIYVNADGSYTDKSITVRNVRYHTTGMSDVEIAKVTLVRKAGSASTSPADGDVLIDQQVAFDFTDTQAKEPGKYYYTVFAYDAEGNYSAAVTEEYELVVKQTYTVTYAAGGAQGEVPVDEMPKVEGTKFNLSAPGSLLKPYCEFNGWNDGTNTYAAGAEYTMPADNVTFTAQWQEHSAMIVPVDAAVLDYSNVTNSVNTEQCDWLDNTRPSINLGSVHAKAQWEAYIQPAQYHVTCLCGVDNWGIDINLSIIDPVSGEELFHGNIREEGAGQKVRTMEYDWDLSGLVEGKYYLIQAEENWNSGTCNLRLSHIDFIPTITIDQSKEDNLIFDGKANVTLIRPLVGGMTNTICLPFALNREQIDEAFGEGAEVWNLTSSTLSDNNMTLDIEFDKVDEMAAGVPYLIQPGTDYDKTANPIFYGVTVSTALAPVEHANLDFIGTVQKSFVSVGYKDHLFVGKDNMVFYSDASDYLNGMRAYFKIKYHEEAPVSAGVQARMILGRTTPTELQTPKATDSVRKVMINGRIHIIRNGRTNDILGNTIK
ncbi:MAG: InlB B-repeat-containing protein [Paludibacteraceae bacterium]|nr:InlB B-repeat-containing protein [Paludibacteraceae bacterium]